MFDSAIVARVPEGAVVRKLSNVGPYGNNIYVLWDEASGDAYVIDAGYEPLAVADAARGLAVKAILVTHGHKDHHENVGTLRELLNAPVGIAEEDQAMLSVKPDFLLRDGAKFRFGPHELRTMHTPGHTPGSMSFLLGDHLFTGDTLFPGGPGNTKSAIGSFPRIIESITTRLFTLPDETNVYPGHGRDTVIRIEKPHLEEWIERGW
jgi:glyoxylase-like metal-dependent hydrolase (beta-lactamase superfamily II)